jgi:hypothetical protein
MQILGVRRAKRISWFFCVVTSIIHEAISHRSLKSPRIPGSVIASYFHTGNFVLEKIQATGSRGQREEDTGLKGWDLSKLI